MKNVLPIIFGGVGAVLLAVGGTATADVVPREGWRMLNGTNALALAGEKVSAPGFDAAAWMPAKVPGTVLDNLVRNGKLPEPYWGLNNRKAEVLLHDLECVYGIPNVPRRRRRRPRPGTAEDDRGKGPHPLLLRAMQGNCQ